MPGEIAVYLHVVETGVAEQRRDRAPLPGADLQQQHPARHQPPRRLGHDRHRVRESIVVGVQRESMRKLAHKSFIWGVYVAPESRGHGVGEKLLSHVLAHAATALGTTQVNLGVNTKNSAAVALYKKLGFVEYGLERGYLLVGGVLEDEYQMVCHVASAP